MAQMVLCVRGTDPSVRGKAQRCSVFHCDPKIEGVAQMKELAFYAGRLRNITTWLDSVITGLDTFYSGNTSPVATSTITATVDPDGGAVAIGLSSVLFDGEFDAMSLSLPYQYTPHGAYLSLNGTDLSYDPSGLSGVEDTLVYVITDGNGGVGRGRVEITVSSWHFGFGAVIVDQPHYIIILRLLQDVLPTGGGVKNRQRRHFVY